MDRHAVTALRGRADAHLDRIHGHGRPADLAGRIIEAIGLADDAENSQEIEPVGLDHGDAVLIAYGNSIVPGEGDGTPLATLRSVVNASFGDVFTAVHVLPFHPSSSDDGFAVIDQATVDPALGSWTDVRSLADEIGLMADLVANHVSAQSTRFQEFIDDVEPGRSWFVTASPDDDLSEVVRPRQHELLLPVETAGGVRHVWCTFSHDQIDVDLSNPDVLVDLFVQLRRLIEAGARFVRLDAVGFVWKRIGTSCLHLPETHEIVKLIRTVVDIAAPWVTIITETNVPHVDNVAYLGDGDEAHAVYNFALPPLLLLSFLGGDATALTEWIASLGDTPPETTFVNFLSSHDGIGLRPLEGLVPPSVVDSLADQIVESGGLVSMANTAEGPRPYELNTTAWSALSRGNPDDIERYVAAHTVMIAMRGLPALYLHALLAVDNDLAAVERTGSARSINRSRFGHEAVLEGRVGRPDVTRRILDILEVRRRTPALGPDTAQSVLHDDPRIVSFIRGSGADEVVAVHNTADVSVMSSHTGFDVLTGRHIDSPTPLGPYECRWLRRV